MGSAGNLRPDQGVLRVKYGGINRFQRFPAQIIIPISGSSQQTGFAHFIFLHGFENLHLVIFRRFIYIVKTLLQLLQYLFAKIEYPAGYPQLPVKIS